MFVPSSETILTSVDDCRGLGGQGGGEKISKSVYKPGGTGELSFFFGLRHLGSLKTKTGYSEKCRSEKKNLQLGPGQINELEHYVSVCHGHSLLHCLKCFLPKKKK